MLQNGVFRTTALLIALLLLAGTAQAFGDLREQAHGLQGQAEEGLTTAIAIVEEQAPATPSEAEAAVDQTERRAQRTIMEVHDELDIEQITQTLENTVLRPLDATVEDIQAQAAELLEDEGAPQDTEPAEEAPVMSTQSEGIWPVIDQPLLLLGATALGLGVVAWAVGQSATIGAGAASTSALGNGRRFIPFASPLFTRFEKDTVLGHPKREAIYGTIIHTPGVTLQDLCEGTGLSRTAVTHHLRLMEQQHLIVSKRVGRSRHFFENGGRYGRHQKDAYAVLHNERTKEIHDYIQSHPGAIQKDLCGAFDIQPSVAHWHVKRLVDANLIDSMRQGRTVTYFPAEGLTPSAAEVAERPAPAPMAARAVA